MILVCRELSHSIGVESSHKMKRSVKQITCRPRVESQGRCPQSDLDSELFKGLEPLPFSPVIIRQRDTPYLAFPIQSIARKVGPANRPSRSMILDHDGFASYASSFSEKHHRVVRMMENIDKHDPIKACVIVWNDFTIETFCGYIGAIARQNVQAA